MGQASAVSRRKPSLLRGCSVIHISLSCRSGRLAGRIRRSG